MIERKPVILGLCTANRARSQMFEAILRHLAQGRVVVLSAGTQVTEVHPLTLQVLHEIEIPSEGLFSKRIKTVDEARNLLVLEDAQQHQIQIPLSAIDQVITLCGAAQESCPAFPSKVAMAHWSIDDPQDLLHFRNARDEILKRVKLFLEVLTSNLNIQN
jgi:protein-tyrosine-phosphatase